MDTGNIVIRDCLQADILHLFEQVVACARLLTSGELHARQNFIGLPLIDRWLGCVQSVYSE